MDHLKRTPTEYKRIKDVNECASIVPLVHITFIVYLPTAERYEEEKPLRTGGRIERKQQVGVNDRKQRKI